MVVYCSYSFITRADVFYTPVQDIEFLNSEGCFELPAPTILDQFLRQYFTNVHPLLPMLSEQDFWDARSRPDPPQSKMLSLLLVQAMLFAACSFMPLKTINRLGYDSIRSARSAFYRKCKLIYDASLEPSKVATAQAALLLTYWTPPLKADSKPNTMWLMIAIENARRCQADRLSDASQFSLLPTSEKSTLRRLWWCCIIRDRMTRWLPISIVAYAAFPLAVHIFDACSDMPQDTSSRDVGHASLLQQRLCTLIKTMKILHEQYDGVDQVVKSIRHIVEYVRSCAPGYITDATPGSPELPGGSELVLRVSLAMDWILSSGSSSEGEDFTSYLRALFHQPCSNMSSAETNNGQTAVRSGDMSDGPEKSASDQPATDWMVNTPPSSAENVGSSISDLLFDPDDFDDSFAERGDQGDWEEESDLEERLEKLLEIGGDLNFDELFATV
ncbi:hypothetical protein BHE90_015560 [Fusarium euwallaceae]|uniref:Xylanolytic transcriptional activator regulatory domain-containing protein n=1 Tax=Fusarium euwallaceae TaxID=1147111 RepID=A0A430L2Y1_9HYPO|nr:hypothetical protein BHE90_015560 [Fusarium euwallaceae]